jgi:hypothetical protein
MAVSGRDRGNPKLLFHESNKAGGRASLQKFLEDLEKYIEENPARTAPCANIIAVDHTVLRGIFV